MARPRRRAGSICSRIGWALPLMVLVLVSGLALGETGRLSARQIEELITGNTILGEWEGQPYAQYFDSNGTSIFHLQDGSTYEGDWYVEDASNRYCSYHWLRGTKCYELYLEEDGVLLWIEEDSNLRLPSRLIEGRQLDLDGVRLEDLDFGGSQKGR